MICTGHPKTVVQPTAPVTETSHASASSPGVASSASSPSTATNSVAPTAPDKPAPPPVIQPVSATSTALPSESKYMFAAERLSKSLGCKSPVAAMTIRTTTGETFTVQCGGQDALVIR